MSLSDLGGVDGARCTIARQRRQPDVGGANQRRVDKHDAAAIWRGRRGGLCTRSEDEGRVSLDFIDDQLRG